MLRNKLLGKYRLRLFAYISLLYFASSELYATVKCKARLESESKNGRFKVVAISHENSLVPYHKSNYEYTFYDNCENRILWERYHNEYPPRRIFVKDDGWVTIRSWKEELTFIDINGKKTGKTENLKLLLSSDELFKHVGGLYSSAGPLWPKYSYSFFHSFDDKVYFVIRLWWDRHFIFDLEKGDRILAGKALEESIEKAERNFVIHTLKEGITHKDYLSQSGFDPEPMLPQIRTQYEDDKKADNKLMNLKRHFHVAAYMAGRMKINEAIPLLRKLEDISYYKSTGSGFAFLRYRQIIQLSLRRLGEKPNSFPSTLVFTYSVVEGKVRETPYGFVPSHLPRDENVSKLTAGMQVTDVLHLLGYPDFISPGKGMSWKMDTYWEYDIDTKDPYSLLLTWNKNLLEENNAFLEAIEIIRPAVWENTLKRDKAIVYW